MDEATLIREAKKGDLTAFNKLVLTYQDMLYNTAYRIIGDPALADDAVQEAFISAFQKLKSYRGGSFKSWLLRIVTNTCYDEFRRQKRKPTTPLDIYTDDGEEIESPSWLKDPTLSPEKQLETYELEQAIQRCIQALPLEFRTVVVLTELQGLSYQEAAKAIKKPLGTIKSRLARARTRLQKCLQKVKELLPAKFRLEGETSS
ncbi:MAG: sigma-70 family RNA polymerase sigma factor [Anaerolineae bacterium]|jgi:RNA polymerase sigma-70 factor, ECF subfamily|nr:sigma-70 family RNA polymerase sigma factor [Anaerolineae bacterium]MBT7073915.1 sigma-70 family RNA polymerase sigma factor [Anaerolineae bacterium]MBT7783193.1 sigma-70 family RNA polymerase sigma factor [Anaerolineae bacterium]